jgi:hypothetical protein
MARNATEMDELLVTTRAKYARKLVLEKVLNDYWWFCYTGYLPYKWHVDHMIQWTEKNLVQAVTDAEIELCLKT